MPSDSSTSFFPTTHTRRALLRHLLLGVPTMGVMAACEPRSGLVDAAARGGEHAASPNSLPGQPLMHRTSDPLSTRMPVLFVGHGSPMNSVLDNVWSQGFTKLGQTLPAPKAIVSISAHWYLGGTYLTGNADPRTIHDFYGFPRELYEVSYPAPGQPQLAERIRGILGDERASLRQDWGLDHGTWSVLKWMFPEADVPVLQLSINQKLTPKEHIALGRALAPLRDEGVLILGSGNIVHNLRDAITKMRSGGPMQTPIWASSFDRETVDVLAQRDLERLADPSWLASNHGARAHPTPDHWLPILYTYGASLDTDDLSSPIEGFDLGSISMRAILWKDARR